MNIEIFEIAKAAYNNSHLAQIGLKQSYYYNKALYQSHQNLLNICQYLYQTREIDSAHLQSLVLQRLDRDIELSMHINHLIQVNASQIFMPYSLKSNKMVEVLAGARELLADTEIFEGLLNGVFPNRLDATVQTHLMLGQLHSVYGSSNATFLSAALIEISCQLLSPSANIQNLMGFFKVELLPITHVLALPNALFQDDASTQHYYEKYYTFQYADIHHSIGLVYVHSGFTFGATRNESESSVQDSYSPQDCSSWIGNLTGFQADIITKEQYIAYQAIVNNQMDSVFDIYPPAKATMLLEKFSPVMVCDPFHDIQAGQLFLYRDFLADQPSKNGVGGHTGLVLGIADDEQIVTLNYRREMPNEEGFGLTLFDWRSNESRNMVFLEVTQPPIISDEVLRDSVFNHQNSLMWEDNHVVIDITIAHPTPQPESTEWLLNSQDWYY